MSQTTERAIAAALKKLLQQKPLNKITISDLANECGINRMTFYYHFKDIYDLIEWMVNEMTTKALEGNRNVQSWQQGTLNVLYAMLEDKTFFMGIYHSLSREQFETYLYNVLYSLLRGAVEQVAADMHVADEDRKFIADFYKYAFSGMLLEWVGSGMKADPNMLVDRIETLCKGDIRRGLERFQRN